ncbi:hypothetical protein [Neobacillus piezotolerans]|nr:hypothetical protein [Neobacillus piezotolerans]
MKSNEEAIADIIKDVFSYIKYLFLSKEEKCAANLGLVNEKYWFQELMNNKPRLKDLLEKDMQFKEYFSSRKNVRKLLRDKDERAMFKKWIENK